MKSMVKDEQKHQHKLDFEHLDLEFKLKKRGQNFAFFVFALTIGLGGYSMYAGLEWGGVIITALGVGGIVSQFLKKR